MSNNTPVTSRQGYKEEIKENECCSFGDPCLKKHKSQVRFMFQNINRIGYSSKHVKADSIRKMIVKNNVDVIAKFNSEKY